MKNKTALGMKLKNIERRKYKNIIHKTTSSIKLKRIERKPA